MSNTSDVLAESVGADIHAVPEPLIADEGSAHPVPYDENLLERARTQWQFGDWASLAKLERDVLQHHPDRAKLALLAAAGHLQTDNPSVARQFVRLAQDWGCSKKLIAQILTSGVHNSLGRASAITNQQARALKHFESAIAVGTPGAESRLLAQARGSEQLAQLGLPGGTALIKGESNRLEVALPTRLPSLSKGIEDLTESLKRQKAELDAQLKKQADELIRVRKSIDASLKKEIANAAKQIEAFIGVQSYLATGDLPNLNPERHSWPVSPDFALYLVELLETKEYDVIIEFGSGISTVIMAKALARIAQRCPDNPVELISFDHLEQYYDQTLAHLKHAGLADTVQLKFAPLKPYTAPSGKTYLYYDCHDTLAALTQRRSPAGLKLLVIVDGPPAATGQHARYPAGPIILSHFKGAHVDLLLDDYIREDEKEIAQLWQAEISAANLLYTAVERKLEKDACLIAITPDSTKETE